MSLGVEFALLCIFTVIVGAFVGTAISVVIAHFKK
jgi:hypothetical protein